MNCPACGNRNPSHAARCMHCNAQLTPESGGFFDVESKNPNSFFNNKVYLFGFALAIGALVVGLLFLKGFDTYDVKCTTASSEIAAYQADPSWERDQSAERRKEERRLKRMGKQKRRFIDDSRYSHRCFRKKTGHVDGVLEK